MTDRPIIFAPDMVRALLSGKKTQTRRLLTPHTSTMDVGAWRNHVKWPDFDFANAVVDTTTPSAPALKCRWDQIGRPSIGSIRPRIEIGDRLWVRENWKPREGLGNGDLFIDYPANDGTAHLDDDIDVGDWRFPKSAANGNVPSIHMPRWASRLTLPVTNVRIQRLQDIDEADAMAEGCKPVFDKDNPHDVPCPNGNTIPMMGLIDAREQFRRLWDRINGKRAAWSTNPWVIATTYEIKLHNIDRSAA